MPKTKTPVVHQSDSPATPYKEGWSIQTALDVSVTSRKGLLAVFGMLLFSATAAGATSGRAPPLSEKAPFGDSTVKRTLSRVRATTVRNYYVTVELVRGILASVDGLVFIIAVPRFFY